VGGNNPAARVLTERLGSQVLKVDDFRGDLAITVDRRAWVEAVRMLRDHPELDFRLFLDLCGVDWLDLREDRYEVVLHVYSVSRKHHVRLKAALLSQGDLAGRRALARRPVVVNYSGRRALTLPEARRYQSNLPPILGAVQAAIRAPRPFPGSDPSGVN
jgi:hypothetical protein